MRERTGRSMTTRHRGSEGMELVSAFSVGLWRGRITTLLISC
jgi:hypothetical protein